MRLLIAFSVIFSMTASVVGSAALSAGLCRLVPGLLGLTPLASWRRTALLWGAVAGVCLTPLSFFTFGWFGAGLGAYFRQFSPLVMMLSIPISIMIGAGLASFFIVAVIFGVIAAIKAMTPLTRCPLFRSLRTSG